MNELPTSTPRPCPLTQELFDERMRIWKDLMDTAEQLLLAGLRHKIGPDGDLEAAYVDWVRQDNARRRKGKWGEDVATVQDPPGNI